MPILTDAELAEIESRMFDAAQAADEGSDLVDNLLILLAADVPPLLAEVRRLREKTMIAEARYSGVAEALDREAIAGALDDDGWQGHDEMLTRLDLLLIADSVRCHVLGEEAEHG